MDDAGERNRRITIRCATITRDELGAEVQTWTTRGTPWATWRRATATERLAAGEVAATITDVFEILHSPRYADLSPLDELIYGGRTYDIVSSAEVGYRETIRISAMARAE